MSRRTGARQLQLYIGVLVFYMTVVYFCVLHVKYSARRVALATAKADSARAMGRARALVSTPAASHTVARAPPELASTQLVKY
jgi:sensor histidine kinase regulating citrate/malate metabolism